MLAELLDCIPLLSYVTYTLSPFDRWASVFVVRGSAFWLVFWASLAGWLISRGCWAWVDAMTWDKFPVRGRVCPLCGAVQRYSVRELIFGSTCRSCERNAGHRWGPSAAMAALFGLYAYSVGKLGCQDLTYGGSVDWIHWRIAYHLVLFSLLVTATVIDFRHYIIPDQMTVIGVVIGVTAATWFGNLQLLPVWVDANQEVPGILGPYVPDWIKQSWHWHGLAYSLAGLVAGAGITWLIRLISSLILGQEALGFGDVTLMGMIGSFIGWQAVLFIFPLAPVCGIIVALGARILTGKTYVPYGPYLSAATVVVLLTWRWIWTPLRFIFGHPPTIGALVGGSILAMAILLAGIRLFRAIPATRR